MLRRRRRGLLYGGIVALCVLPLLFVLVEILLDIYWPCPIELFHQRHAASEMFIDRHGDVLRVTANHSGERFLPIALRNVSPYVIDALVAAEDQRFYQHSGVDVYALSRALAINLLTGRRTSGASTVTMQLCRLIEPAQRSYWSKLKECFRARQWERHYDKDALLEQYLNYAPFGGTLRGIEAASLYWYGKSAADVYLLEAVSLIAMLPAPSRRRPDRAGHHIYCERILLRMLQQGLINGDTCAAARSELKGRHVASAHLWPFLAPHYCDQLVKQGGEKNSACLRRSDASTDRDEIAYPIHRGTLDLNLQQRCEQIINQHASHADGLALVLYGADGVEVMLGAADYQRSQFNAACAAHDAGSTLKPFLYGEALRLGVLRADQLVQDQQTQIAAYRPENYDRGYRSGIRLADALSQSRNVPAVQTVNRLGVDRFAALMQKMDLLGSDASPAGKLYCDAALGTNAVTPLALARAYHRYFCGEDWVGRDALLSYLNLRSPDQQLLGQASLYWKTGTSSGRRDAWSLIWDEERVLVLWMGRLAESSDVNCFGSGVCTDLSALLAAELF